MGASGTHLEHVRDVQLCHVGAQRAQAAPELAAVDAAAAVGVKGAEDLANGGDRALQPGTRCAAERSGTAAVGSATAVSGPGKRPRLLCDCHGCSCRSEEAHTTTLQGCGSH